MLKSPSSGNRAADLYRRCLQGEESAWSEVYGYAIKVARSTTWSQPEEDVRDAAHDAVANILTMGLDKAVHEPRAFLAIVRVSVRRVLIDRYRKAKPVQSLEDPSGSGSEIHRDPNGTNNPENKTISQETVGMLLDALKKIGEKCRAILTLYIRYKTGDPEISSYKQISRMLRRPLGTIGSDIHRCLKELMAQPALRGLLSV